MYSGGQFSKALDKKERKESNACHGGHGSSGARKLAQQNRAKHRAEFEMQTGKSPHPIKPVPRATSHHSGSSISQQQYSNRRRRSGSGRGVAYICLGLLGGFFIVTGALLMAFGFTSEEFSWTNLSVGMILAYCGIGISVIGLLFIFICIIMCCTDRRRKKADVESLDGSHDSEQRMIEKQYDTQPQKENGKRDSEQQNSKSSLSDGTPRSAERKNTDGRPLPKTPSYSGSYTTT
ncbi:uncharacterized protein [Amphiura filiformis]|uniref:uncharacterized protein n=1 Tax=Amphiura filiformis TaxID=82378 RepID=UPI003B2209D9